MELLGLLLPAVIDVLTRKIADSDVRFWLSVLVCAVVGIFLNWLSTSFAFVSPLDAFNSITTSIMATFGLAQLSFKAFWENSQVRAKAFGIDITSDPDNLK